MIRAACCCRQYSLLMITSVSKGANYCTVSFDSTKFDFCSTAFEVNFSLQDFQNRYLAYRPDTVSVTQPTATLPQTLNEVSFNSLQQ